jgi:uncharacterized Zn-finger protein
MFTSNFSLEAHTKVIHQGEKPNKCEVCGLEFGYKRTYRIHMLQGKINKVRLGEVRLG